MVCQEVLEHQDRLEHLEITEVLEIKVSLERLVRMVHPDVQVLQV
jgi:hypothetical protein